MARSSGMRILLWALCGVFVLGLLNPSEAQAESDLEEAGDWLQVILPVAGFGATYIADDKVGRVQFIKQFGASVGTMLVLKQANDKWRPNAVDANSYPSGHTTGAFTGAWFLQMRYGDAAGYPAIALATLTAYSRVKAQAHFADDVLAGAGITLLYNFAFVTPFEERLSIRPTFDSRGMGIQLDLLAADSKPTVDYEDFDPRFRFELEFNPVWQATNDVQSPSGTGDLFSLVGEGWEETMNPSVTTLAKLEFLLQDGHELAFLLNPYETRDFGTFSNPVNFAGVTFPANTALRNEYRYYDFRIRYRYNTLKDSDKWDLYVGAGVGIMGLTVRMYAETGEEARVDDLIILPLAHFGVVYHFSKKWSLIGEFDGTSFKTDQILEWALLLRWRFHPRWELTAGYRWQDRDIDTSDLYNKLRVDRAVVAMAYYW